MKILIRPFFVLWFLLLSGVSFAVTDGKTKKSGEDPREENQLQEQDGKNQKLSENVDEDDESDIQEIDSADNDSVSKYNFIFYFLYKLNYNNDKGRELEVF